MAIFPLPWYFALSIAIDLLCGLVQVSLLYYSQNIRCSTNVLWDRVSYSVFGRCLWDLKLSLSFPSPIISICFVITACLSSEMQPLLAWSSSGWSSCGNTKLYYRRPNNNTIPDYKCKGKRGDVGVISTLTTESITKREHSNQQQIIVKLLPNS